MAMLQPHMMSIRIKACNVKGYEARLVEIKRFSVVQPVATRRASVQTMKIIMRCVRIDSVRCFNGQYVA